MSGRPVRMFISYAHADRAVVELLLDHLGVLANAGRIELFTDEGLVAGEEWDARLRQELAQADIVLFVVTAKFLRSSYCARVELAGTIRRREEEGIVVIPVIAEHCLWKSLPLARLQALPKDKKLQLKPLNKWGRDTDVALNQIADHVQINLDQLAATRLGDVPPAPRGWRQPDPPDRCLGRVRDVSLLVDALMAEPCKPIVVLGGAGMGKSTLTREAAAHASVLGRYGDRRVWVALDKVTEPDIVPVAIGDALGLPPASDPWPGIEDTLRGAPALVLLDNLETPWDPHPISVEGILGRLSRLPRVALMASLRGGAAPTSPVWGTRLEAGRLVTPHDGDLLRAIAADIPADDPQLPEVLRALDGWPLAIELFAAQADGLGGLESTWRRWQAERTAMLARGQMAPDRFSSLAVSLGFSLASPRMRLSAPNADAPARLYAMLGRLPDGMASDDADALLSGAGGAAADAFVRARLAHKEGRRVRMLAPVREHAARIDLTPADQDALYAHYLGLAAELRRYFNGEYLGIDLPRLRAELVNLEALLAAETGVGASTAVQRDFGNLLIAFGDARRELGQLAPALGDYLQARSIIWTLTTSDPDNAEWQRDLFISQSKVADVLIAQGKLPEAVTAYEAVLKTNQKLAAADSGNPRWQRDLSVSWTKLGDVRRAQGDLEGALQAFTESKNIADRLAAAEPGNAQWQRDLSIGWNRLGDVRLAQGDLLGALQAYTEDKNIADRLAVAEPGNAQWQRDLSVSWDRLGDVRRAQGDLLGALQAYTESKNIRDKLAAADPGNAQWQRDLSVGWERLASVREAQEDEPGALAAWREAMAISERLARDFPDSIDMQTTQVVHLAGVARHLDPADPAANAEAMTLLERALAVLRPLAEAGRLDAQHQSWVDLIEQQRAALDDPAPP